MQQQLKNPLDNAPMRLTLDEMVNPSLVVKNFFYNYSLRDIRTQLEDLVVQAMSSEMPELENWRERNTILYFRAQLELFLEASYMLTRENESTVGKKKKGRRSNTVSKR